MPSQRAFRLLLLLTLLAWGWASPIQAEDEPEKAAPTIPVDGKALDAAALRARETAIQAELTKIAETPAADPEARKKRTEPRASLVSALTGAVELMTQIAGAQGTSKSLEEKITAAQAALTEAQAKVAAGPKVTGEVNEDRMRALEAQSAKTAQEVKRTTESVKTLEEALKKRQTDFDALATRQAELKTRGEALRAQLAKTAEDDAQDRELLAIQIETNEVRRGVADLRQANHVVLLQLDTLRRDLAILEAEIARTQQTSADALLAKTREVREANLRAEARRREEEAARQLREAELEAEPAAKANKRLEALVGRIKTERAQDRSKTARLKTLRDEGRSLAQTSETRLKSMRLLYPAGQGLEPWQREGLAEQVRQQEQDRAEFNRFRARETTNLNALLADALTRIGRLQNFERRLGGAKDRIESGANDAESIAAVERELEHSRDQDYKLWLEARLDILRGQTDLTPDEITRFKAQWLKTTGELELEVKGRIEDLGELRLTAEDLRAAIQETAKSLDARRAHLDGVTFWLRESSLFSDENLEQAGEEAWGLGAQAASIPDELAALAGELTTGDESRVRPPFAILGFLLLAVFFGSWFHRQLGRTALLARPVAELGRLDRMQRLLAELFRGVWLPGAVLLAALYADAEVFRGRAPGVGLVALALVWTAFGLARGLNRGLFVFDAAGACAAGCNSRTARGARRALRTLLIGSGVFLAALLVLRSAEAPHLGRLVAFAWGVGGLALGSWLAFRHDILTVLLPTGRGGLMGRTLRGLLRFVWPLVVLLGGAILTLNAFGYNTASAFYARRVLWCAVAFLALGIVHAVLRALVQRRLPVASGAGDDELITDQPDRAELLVRFLGGLLTAGLLVGLAVTLSLVFNLGYSDWEYVGGISLTGDEAGAGLTIGRLARALLIFWVGLALARFARDSVRAVLRARGVNRGSRYVVRTLLFYTLVTIGTLSAIAALGIEMSQFGWFLTAAGVGIGFGLQEIISNFICGLILFFERPVQVGDVITIGSVLGDVQQINIRSTIVRTREGVAIIIPNKRLITEDVVNWSHGEQRTRMSIGVGVAYGSDVPVVRKTLLEVATSESRFMRRPAPEVNFLGFGESELQFEVMAWLPTPDPTLRRRVSSAMNTRIDELFRERGVEIPFPQRDLHLRSSDIGGLRPTEDEPPAP
jgi:small-conductance mechanosensitive channel